MSRLFLLFIAAFFASACVSALSDGPSFSGEGYSEPATSDVPGENAVVLRKGKTYGNTIEVEVHLRGKSPVFAVSFRLRYEADALKWKGTYMKGEFFEKGGAHPVYMTALDGREGKGLIVAGVSSINTSSGTEGQGIVISIPFEKVSREPSTLAIEGLTVIDSQGEVLSFSPSPLALD